MLEERDYWVGWSQLSGVGPISLQRLKTHFGSLETAWTASSDQLLQVEGFGPQTVAKILEQRSQFDLGPFLAQHLEKNPQFWTPVDPDYPRLLLEIPTPPGVLYYRGTMEPGENQGKISLVAMVGTRNPSEYGRRWAQKIATVLARRGFTIVSGMAAGIDEIAHRSSLEAGGRTLAVFGTGIDLVYPRENRALCQQLLPQGLILSEYPAGTKPNPKHFPSRNRIVAGLSRAVFVMEAGQKSGALITAYLANEFCRDVFVLPGRLDDEKSQGCLQLISRGAGVIPVNLEELLEQLGGIPDLDSSETYSNSAPDPQQLSLIEAIPQPIQPPANLDPDLASVLEVVPAEPMVFDWIVRQSGQDAATVSSALLQLELLGLVTQQPGMRYQRH
ncbi:MAG: DNA-protecting protein DprA [Oscillatoriales cyanobacterium RM2_1_1]|nr:DNA-protecting protein DprA [Oscillatoriales cyanobacterium SM2_3_0]NJO44763.1 DNA-protecting protein DprA [Oscillatoriales cyanobacterium RM2_1_1]